MYKGQGFTSLFVSNTGFPNCLWGCTPVPTQVGRVTPVIGSLCEEHLGAIPFGNGLVPLHVGPCAVRDVVSKNCRSGDHALLRPHTAECLINSSIDGN